MPESSFKYFAILSHPVRREILKFIQHNSPVMFTELNRHFKLEVGTLYYHLKIMKPLIQQDTNHHYYLTDEGKAAYQLVTQTPHSDLIESAQPPSRRRAIAEKLLLKPLIVYIKNDLKRSGFEALIISVSSSFLAYLTGLMPELLFYTSRSTQPFWVYTIGIFIRWLYLFAIVQAMSRWLFNRKENSIYLLIAIPFCTIPLSLYPLTWFTFILMLNGYYVFVDLALQLLVQIWTLASLSLALTYIKSLRIERAVLIALFAQYINVLLIWFIMVF
ncbi:MAG: winged helix-turn-helix domain-containing protein [Candidatus Ranarchaeia archaeon]